MPLKIQAFSDIGRFLMMQCPIFLSSLNTPSFLEAGVGLVDGVVQEFRSVWLSDKTGWYSWYAIPNGFFNATLLQVCTSLSDSLNLSQV
jgi:hypothetical protein